MLFVLYGKSLLCVRPLQIRGRPNVARIERAVFSYDGFDYFLDLCDAHAREFHRTAESFVSWASSRTPQAARRPRRQAANTPDSVETAHSGGPALRSGRRWASKPSGQPRLADEGRGTTSRDGPLSRT